MRRRVGFARGRRPQGFGPAGATGVPGAWAPGAGALRVALVVAGVALLGPVAPAAAQTLLTQEEALALAFPAPVEVERKTAYLSEDQLHRARQLAGSDVPIEQGIVSYYVGSRDGRPVGVAYFDVHRVRTMEEVAMVVVTPDGRVERIDVLKFAEPPEYRAPEGWIDQIEGRRLDGELSLRGGVRNLTGATLTARALTRAARRVLALHVVIGSPGVTP